MAATCIEVPYRVRTGSNGGNEERKRLIDSRGGTKWGKEENQGRTTGEEKEKHRKVTVNVSYIDNIKLIIMASLINWSILLQ